MSSRTRCIFSALLVASCITAHESARAADTALHLGADFRAIGDQVGTDDPPTRVQHLPTGIVLVLIQPGEFTMGSPDSEAGRERSEVPRRAVVGSAFYLGETEVTAEQWNRVMGAEHAKRDDEHQLPATDVTWYDAKAFVEKLNHGPQGPWRLPSEAEWEYACRAGTTTPFAFGERVTTKQVHYAGQRRSSCGRLGPRPDGPVPVRSLPPNPWGLYEMHGNQLEWCEDLWVFEPRPGVEASDVEGAPRVVRGGSFTATACQTRSSFRDGYPPNSGGDKYGFRVARSITTPATR